MSLPLSSTQQSQEGKMRGLQRFPEPPFTNQSSNFLSTESPSLIPRFFKARVDFSPKLRERIRNGKPAFKVTSFGRLVFTAVLWFRKGVPLC